VGASAAIFGLLGAVVYYGRRSGSRAASSQAWSYAVTAGAMGFIMSGVDNAAHLGGFAGGYLAGRVLDPLKQERIDHIVIAVICLLLSMVSIAPQIIAAVIAILS
jgi:rhomboid protease GluP